jgi:hypothetical protein
MNRVRLVASTALALVAGTASEGWAKEKAAYCQIDSAGLPPLRGRCLFDGESDGSFALSNVDSSKPLLGEVELVHVVVISPGVAEVRGLTRSGINSRWGEAHRWTGDRACWAGVDFRICAY